MATGDEFGTQPVLAGLVKGMFVGVICAFQAHTDTAVLPDVVARIATVLPADPGEIEERLLDQRRAVRGVGSSSSTPTARMSRGTRHFTDFRPTFRLRTDVAASKRS